MKRVLLITMVLVLCSFVFAVGSEVATDFSVNSPKQEVMNYVSSGSIVGDYFGYLVLIIVALVLVYFISKSKKVSKKKKSSRKKLTKKKK